MTINYFKWLFVSEIKGIQDYILATDKLKHIVGASEIIASITERSFYEKVLKSIGCEYDDDYKVMMAAAGRLMLLFKDESKLKDLMAVWSIVINEYAPGVELVYDYFQIDSNNLQESRKIALEKMTSVRQQANCSLPVPSLPVERCRRDGLAAVAGDKKEGPISNQIKRKIDTALNSRVSLINKFIPTAENIELDSIYMILNNPEIWPIDFKDITGHCDKDYMAVVHIDVNSMGIFFRKLGDQLKNKDAESILNINRAISDNLLKAAEESAKEAVQTIIATDKALSKAIKNGKTFPFRPLVLAGDDLTFVIKSPYAIDFSKSYMLSFNKKAKQKLTKIFDDYQLKFDSDIADFKLSAGITFTKSNFPFKSAYELCENLCKKGKDLSNRNVSTISFYRQTTATCDDLDNLLDREFKNKGLELTYKAYALEGNIKDLPFIDDLTDIVSVLNKLPRGSLRKIASKLFSNKNTVDMAWDRFKKICSERNPKELKKLIDLLRKITKAKEGEEPLWEKMENNTYRTSLADAINLHSVTSDFYMDSEDRGDE